LLITSYSLIFFVSSENSLLRSACSFAFSHDSPRFGPRPPKGFGFYLSFVINCLEYYLLLAEIIEDMNDESSNNIKLTGFYFG